MYVCLYAYKSLQWQQTFQNFWCNFMCENVLRSHTLFNYIMHLCDFFISNQMIDFTEDKLKLKLKLELRCISNLMKPNINSSDVIQNRKTKILSTLNSLFLCRIILDPLEFPLWKKKLLVKMERINRLP